MTVEKKEKPTVDLTKLNIYQKLQKVRKELKDMNLSKSGKNKDKGFKYYELGDFLPQATELFDKYGLCPVYFLERTKEEICKDDVAHLYQSNFTEYGILKIFDGESCITFTTPTAENVIYKNVWVFNAASGKNEKSGDKTIEVQNDIQNLGSKLTYIKRYLYMNALDLTEPDGVDGDEDDETTPALAPIPLVKPATVKAPYSKAIVEPKPVIKTVEPIKPVVEPIKPVVEPIKPVVLLTGDSKDEIIKIMAENGLKIPTTIDKIASQLETDKALLREDQKEEIITIINSMKGE